MVHINKKYFCTELKKHRFTAIACGYLAKDFPPPPEALFAVFLPTIRRSRRFFPTNARGHSVQFIKLLLEPMHGPTNT